MDRPLDALPQGTKLAGYVIGRVLGRGGFGITYYATDALYPEVKVAIKEFLPAGLAMRQAGELSVHPTSPDRAEPYKRALASFEKEARTMVALRHPNVVEVQRYIEQNGTAYVVMKYEEGKSLADLLAGGKTLTEAEILDFLPPLLDGLEAVHAKKFLHRDVKPGNIYLRSADGSPVLLDFGAARQAIGDERKTSLSEIYTPGFAPLEQYDRHAEQGPFTDIYALGATLYRCIAGEAPPEAITRHNAMRRGGADPIASFAPAAQKRYSPALIAAVEKALALDERARPQTIAELRALLPPADTLRVAAPPAGATLATTVLDTTLATPPPAPAPAAAPPQASAPAPAPAPAAAPRPLSPIRRRLQTQRSWGWIAATAMLVLVVAGPGIGYWRELMEGEAIPESAPSPPRIAGRAGKEADRRAPEEADARRRAEEARRREEEEKARRSERERAVPSPPFSATPVLTPGNVFRDCAECPEMVVIPAGTFTMGSPLSEVGRDYHEGPQHQVTIAKPFALGKYEVTLAEWDACVSAGGCAHRPGDRGWGRGRRPVFDVSWDDAKQYVAWLSHKTGKSYRLPSEAEWEYAARAGTTTRYSWGDNIGANKANCDGCGSQWDNKQTAPVGYFAANRFGLHDMHGNVWEWVEDCWNGSYHGAPGNGRPWLSGKCASRVERGGSWSDNPERIRSAFRFGSHASDRGNSSGFRVARTLD